ncbi:hypothetical protein CEUSTIGMA_g8206.t1 [Chlamydomonas eustigma]|uniref:Uncharacterized protein n=1 Tax=Chlamydomonas eustigma TaxID=1157962 RepID=A0A250XCG8_9CHLO|nr:hypothetical protein CEUSTIGMA_g8206.t1 [Chlamydomonas eustigma]|eukprot:GAX80771.1 hypothetical protein CEUSTIGMA_g8206.t1 [Chlamydomonas eustigma]
MNAFKTVHSSRSIPSGRSAVSSRARTVSVKAGLFDFLKKEEEEEVVVGAPPAKKGGLFGFFNKDEDDVRLSKATKVINAKPVVKAKVAAKAAPDEPKKGFSLPFFGGAKEEEEPRPKVTAKKVAPKSNLNLPKKKKEPYVYKSSGVRSDLDFSTVEINRTGKMRPKDIDLEKPRSYWN